LNDRRIIEVGADWVELGGPTVMGHLTATPARGKEVFAFEYNKAWDDRQDKNPIHDSQPPEICLLEALRPLSSTLSGPPRP